MNAPFVFVDETAVLRLIHSPNLLYQFIEILFALDCILALLGIA